MLESTFQLGPGLGPARERRLWQMGIRRWQDFSCPPADGGANPRLRSAVATAQRALRDRDSERLAAMLPSRERWRMFAAFGEDAAYLDIETGGDERDFAGVTAVSLLDRNGPRLFLAGRNLADFPAVARGHSMLVTFNGLSFDVPILRRAFPGWEPPLGHVDLRHVWARLGHHGGLKSLERKMGLGR
ncbi:MAG TPA: ribonuclease H-like domain-containing protein, partial [Polyangia bacterium]|nr:ribonuclease H-like domain-containing protein [Polyangia bacterium]